MQILYEWIRTLVVFIMFATILDLLLPKSDFQKYVKMVISLILLLIMISPLFKLLKVDFEEAISQFQNNQAVEVSSMKNNIELKKIEIEKEQHAYILNQMAVLLINRVEEELKGEYETKITDLEIVMEDNKEYSVLAEDIANVFVTVTKEESDELVEKVKPIEEIRIETNQTPVQEIIEEIPVDDITDLLSREWEIEDSKINISYKEGR